MPDRRQDHSEIIRGMTDAEAKTYLLDVVQSSSSRLKVNAAHIIDLAAADGVSLALKPAVLLALLYESKGRIVVYDVMLDRLEFMTGMRGSDTVDVHTTLKNARKALSRLGWPVAVDTVYGLGCRLTVSGDWHVNQITNK